MTFYVYDGYSDEEYKVNCDSKLDAVKKVLDHYKDGDVIDGVIDYLSQNQEVRIVNIDSLNEL